MSAIARPTEHAEAVPAAPADAEPPVRPAPRAWARNPAVLFALAVFATFPAFFLAAVPRPLGNTLAAAALALVAVASLASAVLAIAAIVRRIGGRARPGDLPVVAAVFLVPLASFWSLVGSFLALWATSGFRRGRQLHALGRVLLPPVVPGDAWTGPRAHELEAIPPPARAALAAAWRENGRTEHASVAAFARLTLDLVDLGAPPALLVDAQRDAADEVRHAELCFGLARALDGRAAGPGAFPAAGAARGPMGTRNARLVALAVSSLVDGALHEGVSARVIARLARRCEIPSIAALLRTIARDEGRHAAHGWDVVRWCVAEGGEPVRAALSGALRALPASPRSTFANEARDGDWERFGLHGRALEDEEYANAIEFLRERVVALSASSTAGRAALD